MKLYKVTFFDEEEKKEIKSNPIGWIEIMPDGRIRTILFNHFHDAQSSSQISLNRDIKKIYNVTFPCSVFFLNPRKGEDKLDEDNIAFIPRDNGTGKNDIAVANYIKGRMKNYPPIEEIDRGTAYIIRNGELEKTTIRELVNLTAKARGIDFRRESRRNAVYPFMRYKNSSNRSGVYGYAISPDDSTIYVYFTGKKRGFYKYDTESAPSYVIKEMIRRARGGWGLNRYINKHPKTYYWKGTY